MNKRRLGEFAFVSIAFLIVTSCAYTTKNRIVASANQPQQKILPRSGPGPGADIDESLAEAARL